MDGWIEEWMRTSGHGVYSACLTPKPQSPRPPTLWVWIPYFDQFDFPWGPDSVVRVPTIPAKSATEFKDGKCARIKSSIKLLWIEFLCIGRVENVTIEPWEGGSLNAKFCNFFCKIWHTCHEWTGFISCLSRKWWYHCKQVQVQDKVQIFSTNILFEIV